MRLVVQALFASALVAAGMALSGCTATPPADPEALADYNATNDPFEPTNRKVYAADDAVNTAVLAPIARGYRAITPQTVRDSVDNFLVNLGEPIVLGNDMLQGKPRRAGDSLMRFLINSTVGVAGVFDVASGWGYPAHGGGFANTLAVWGVQEGPFLELPLFGPSNPRDGIGLGIDMVSDPLTWVSGGGTLTTATVSRTGVSAVDAEERNLDSIESVKKTALDPYATFRSLYRQHRDSDIADIRADDRHTIPVWFDRPSN